jgi:hypothetical protein
MGKENRFALKSLGFLPPFLSQISPRSTIHMSHLPYTKPPRLNLYLTRDPWLAGTVTGAKITAARLTGGSRALVGWSVTSGRSRRSRRCVGRRRRWSELLWPRAQAVEVGGGTCSGQTMAVGFNQSARGAPLGDVEAMRARNREMVQWFTGSTCSGGVTNSGEHDLTAPMGLVLGSSLGKLHGLSGKLSEGSDRAEVSGIGLVTVVALGRLWRVTGRSPEQRASSGKPGAVWRGDREGGRAWGWAL